MSDIDEKAPHEVETTQDVSTIDRALEKKVLRKLDLKVIPILCFLFFISFLDRGNIGR